MGPVRDVLFDIKGRDSTAAAWDSARRQGEQFNRSVVEQTKEQIVAYQRVIAVRKLTAAEGRRGQRGSRGEDVAAYGKELDRLRSKFNPAYAAISKYKREQEQLNVALKSGAISEHERAVAMSASRISTLSSLAAMKGRNRELRSASGAIKLNNFQLQNMSYQMNDMAVMMASGQSPFVMLMQQGMQIGQIFGPGASVQGAMKSVGVGIATFVTNPINLAILATATLAGGAAMVYRQFSGEPAKKANDMLKDHNKWVNQLEKEYAGAAAAAKSYRGEISSMPRGLAIAEGLLNQNQLLDIANLKIKEIGKTLEFTTGRNLGKARDIRQLKAYIGQFREGKVELNDFRVRMAQIQLDPTNSDRVKELASELGIAAGEAARLQNAAEQVGAALDNLQSTGTRQFDGLKFVGDAIKQIRQFAPELRTQKQQIDDIFGNAVPDAKTTSAVAALDRARSETLAAIDEQRRREDALEADRKANAEARKQRSKAVSLAKKQERQATSAANKLAREGKRIAESRVKNTATISDMQEEVAILGQSSGLRKNNLIILEQERAVRSAIARLGKYATQDEIAMVRELIPERMRLFEVVKQEDEAMNYAKSSFKGFFSDFRSNLKEGQKGWDAFGDAGLSALGKISDRLIDMAIDNLFDNAFGGGNGKSSGGFLSSLFSAFGGGSKVSADPWEGMRIPSYEGGGSTGQGSRSGGVDGRGGFFAINHPNETVIDHTLGSQGLSIPSPANNNQPQQVIVRVVASSEFDTMVEEISGKTSAQVVRAASPAIINQAVAQGQKNAADGGLDGVMSGRYSSAPKTAAR